MPFKTNPPLVVNSDTPLAFSVSTELFKSIRRRHPKKFKHCRTMELREFTERRSLNILWQSGGETTFKYLFRFLRAYEEINSHFQESRHPDGKARGGRIAGYLTDEQHSQTEWIGASKYEFIFEQALNIQTF